MTLAEVAGQTADQRWSAVVEAATEHIGVPPADAWVHALTEQADGPGRQDESGDEWTTRCPNPGHNGDGDTKASLRWVVAADGSVLFNCMAGCDGQAILNALSLSFLQLRWPKTHYLYRNLDRQLMAVHTKTAAKQFAWLHPTDDGDGYQAGRGDRWTDRLWLAADLQEQARAAHLRGARVAVWLCYSPDTEVLTPDGWIKLPELPEDARVAQYEQGTEHISFIEPLARQVFDYDGPMIQFDSKASSLQVTPDHRTLTKYRHAGNVTIPAEAVRCKRLLPVSGIKPDGKADWTSDEARLWAAWQADGVKPSRGHQGGWNIKRSDKNTRLHALLTRLDVPFEILFLDSRPGFTYTKIDMRSHRVFSRKQFDWSILDWPNEVRTAWLEELRYWDGEPNTKGSFRYFTSYEPSADIVTAVAAITGWGASKRTYRREDRPASQTEYSVSLSPNTRWREMTKPTKRIERVAGGKVYCLSVPSTYLVVRRAGRVSISGNCEGEKDVENVTRAIEAGWGPQRLGSQAGAWADLVTTAADGADSWSLQLSEDLVNLRPDRLVILADNDEAGIKRTGRIISALLIECARQGTAFEIEALSWLHTGIKDATDAINRWRRGWLTKASAVNDADEYRFASHKTGWLAEVEATDRAGEGTGELALGRLAFGRKQEVSEEPIAVGTVRVRNVLVDRDGAQVGWEISIGRGSRHDTELVMVNDLGPGLGQWNARVGLFITSVRGAAEAFGAYLRHHGQRAPQVICYDHEGWVTADTFVTKEDGVLVGPETGSDGVRGARVADTADSWHFGTRGAGGTDRAAELIAEIGSFRDWDESGPVLGWLAGVAVAPYAADAVGMGSIPGLQAVGTSGHGKTRWLELACRLFGLKTSGIGSVTAPGLIRSLASCTGVLWIDDANLDERAGDLLRGAITGGARARGNIDGGKGVTADRSVAALLYSAESGFRLNEKAMRERCAVVRFDKAVQQRVSRRNTSDGSVLAGPIRKQYEDMIDLGSGSASKTRLLTDYAGLLVVELATLVRRQRRENGGAERRIGAGLREAAAYRFCLWGAELLADWLIEHGQPEAALGLRDGVSMWATREIARAEKAEQSGVGHYLVTEMVPRAIEHRRRRGSWRGSGGLGYVQPVTGADGEEWGTVEAAEALRDAWRAGIIGGRVGAGGAVGHSGVGMEFDPAAVVVLVDAKAASGDAGISDYDGVLGVAVAPDLVYRWATSKDGLDAGIIRDGRYTNLDAIRAQLAEVADKEVGPVRIKAGSAHTRVTYRVITDPAVLGRIRENEGQI